MKILLIGNIVLLAVLAVFTTILFVNYLKAEKKLAKHGESTIFKRD